MKKYTMEVVKPKNYKQSEKAENLLKEAAEKVERTKGGISEAAQLLMAEANRAKLKAGLIKGGKLLKGT